MWKEDSQASNEGREKELSSRFFKMALDKGAQMVRYDDTASSAHNIIRRIAVNHPVVLQIQRELVDEHKDLIDAITRENQELREQTRRYQTELSELREEVRWALEETNRNLEERAKAELVDLTRRLQDVIDARAADRAILEREVLERERVEAEYKRQLADLTRHIQDQTNAFAAYRASLEQEMRELRDRVATAVMIPPPVSPRPALCVKVVFCSVADDD